MRRLSAAIATTALCSALSAPVMAEPMTYSIDPEHTNVIVSWSHFGFSYPTATFSGAQGTLTYDNDNVSASSIEVSIDVETVDSYSDKLNEEFLGEEYFYVDEYPQATFKSTKVTANGDNQLSVTGDLTIKGTTRQVTFDATLNKQAKHPMTEKPAIGFNATTTVMRSDFGLDKYVPDVSDKIVLQITTEAQAK